MTKLLNQISALLALLFALTATAQPSFVEGHPAPEMEALFQQTNGWIGGDGVYSVALTPERTLWLFSDTWIGKVRDNKRIKPTLVNNTLAIQDGRGPNTKLQFIVRSNANNRPAAFVTPEDQHGWFWLQSGACLNSRLFFFMAQIEKTDAPGVFSFRQCSQSLAVVTNPLAPLFDWHIEQKKLPWVDFTSEHSINFGAADLVDGGFLYVYGTDDEFHSQRSERYLTVARVPTSSVADFSTWRFYAEGQWLTDSHHATKMLGGLATEFSVSYLPKIARYLLVYTDHGLSPKILIRTARHPWGEWSAATTVYRCPEMSRDKRIFCYAAKAHPSQGTDDALMISYVANSYDVGQVIADASLYWPRFVRVPLASTTNIMAK